MTTTVDDSSTSSETGTTMETVKPPRRSKSTTSSSKSSTKTSSKSSSKSTSSRSSSKSRGVTKSKSSSSSSKSPSGVTRSKSSSSSKSSSKSSRKATNKLVKSKSNSSNVKSSNKKSVKKNVHDAADFYLARRSSLVRLRPGKNAKSLHPLLGRDEEDASVTSHERSNDAPRGCSDRDCGSSTSCTMSTRQLLHHCPESHHPNCMWSFTAGWGTPFDETATTATPPQGGRRRQVNSQTSWFEPAPRKFVIPPTIIDDTETSWETVMELDAISFESLPTIISPPPPPPPPLRDPPADCSFLHSKDHDRSNHDHNDGMLLKRAKSKSTIHALYKQQQKEEQENENQAPYLSQRAQTTRPVEFVVDTTSTAAPSTSSGLLNRKQSPTSKNRHTMVLQRHNDKVLVEDRQQPDMDKGVLVLPKDNQKTIKKKIKSDHDVIIDSNKDVKKLEKKSIKGSLKKDKSSRSLQSSSTSDMDKKKKKSEERMCKIEKAKSKSKSNRRITSETEKDKEYGKEELLKVKSCRGLTSSSATETERKIQSSSSKKDKPAVGEIQKTTRNSSASLSSSVPSKKDTKKTKSLPKTLLVERHDAGLHDNGDDLVEDRNDNDEECWDTAILLENEDTPEPDTNLCSSTVSNNSSSSSSNESSDGTGSTDSTMGSDSSSSEKNHFHRQRSPDRAIVHDDTTSSGWETLDTSACASLENDDSMPALTDFNDKSDAVNDYSDDVVREVKIFLRSNRKESTKKNKLQRSRKNKPVDDEEINIGNVGEAGKAVMRSKSSSLGGKKKSRNDKSEKIHRLKSYSSSNSVACEKSLYSRKSIKRRKSINL